MSIHRFPSLTREQLRAIWERNPLPVVRRLLWEVYRLRVVVLRTSGFVRMLRHQGDHERLAPMSKTLLTSVEEVLRDESVVKEDDARRL